ncbi:MAG: helix-turn-helix transcriptional regulator, partial [Candidatus Dormibacteria bacterium]
MTGAAALAEAIRRVDPSPHRDYVLGSLALISGRREEAERLLVGAYELGDAGTEPRLVADIAGQLANLCLTRGKGGETAMWAARALDCGQGMSLLSTALTCRVIGLAFAGRVAEGLAAVASLPDAPAELDLISADGYLGRGYAHYITDDLAGACADLVPIAALFRRRGPAYLAVAALQTLSWVEYRLGTWDDAILHGGLAASIGEDTDQSWLLSSAHLGACAPLAARGEWEAAQLHADAACAAAAVVGLEFASTGFAAMAVAHIARARGDHAGVVRALEVLLPLETVEVLGEPGILGWQELYAEALVNLGRLDAAESVLVPHEELAAARDRRSAMAGAARVRGTLESARGRRDAAAAAFAFGLEQLEGLEMPFERALTELEYGGLLRR